MSEVFDATLFGAVFVTLFVIMDPLGSIPLFLGLTGGRTNKTRARLAGQAVLVSLLVISLFAVVGQQILGFLGTSAWFFFLVNVFKVPFSVQLGLITQESLMLCLVLTPAVVAGALMGPPTIARISRGAFERLVLALTVGASLYLLF